jgi:hypothetical protein
VVDVEWTCVTCGAGWGLADRFCGGCGAERPQVDVESEDATRTVVRERVTPTYEVGAIVNGHRFNGVAWLPVAPGAQLTIDEPNQALVDEQVEATADSGPVSEPVEYEVGAIVNGHRFNGVEWLPVAPVDQLTIDESSQELVDEQVEATADSGPGSEPVEFEVGAIVNGHRFNGVEWLPAAPPPPTNAIPAPPPAPAAAVPSLGALWRRWRTWVVAGTALAVVAVGGLVTYNHLRFTVQTSEGELADAAGTLAQVEKDWRSSSLPPDHVKISDDAGCWYVLDKGDQYAGRIACGGARIVGSADGQVWWEMAAEPVEKRGHAEIDPDAVYVEAGPVPRPAGVRLADSSGDGPGDAVDAVAAPALDRADPGLVRTDYYPDTTGLEPLELGADSEIHLPAGVLRVQRITELPSAVLDDEGDDVGDDEGWGYLDAVRGPADGEEFRLVEWAFTAYSDEDYSDYWFGEVPATTVTVSDGETALSDVTSLSEDSAEGSTLVSAPAGAVLRLETDGVVETLDLTTGKASTNPGSAPYRLSWWQEPAQELTQTSTEQSTPVPDEGKYRWQVERTVVVDQVALAPYLPAGWGDETGGWADEGMAWLVLRVEAQDSTVDDVSGPSLDVSTTSATDVWSVKVDGQTYRAAKQPAEGWADYRVAVQVPAATTAAQLTLATTEAFELTDWWDVETKQSVSYAPVSYDVDFTTAP